MNSRNEIKLYNILFPIWLLILMPTAWIAVLPVNFIVDSLVLIIASKKIGIFERGTYKKHILKVWIFGFLADMIGAGLILGVMSLFDLNIRGDEPILTVPALLLSAIFIFIFNYAFSFKNLDKAVRFKMALSFAVFTAPYTFLIPLNWIYGF
ncbi:MAG: hypothetical protein IJX58_05795 [Clostridia bacterium]|nr:hypothetical protein [Clostridia bacterium]